MVKLVDLYELNCSAPAPIISIADPDTSTEICKHANNASEVSQLNSLILPLFKQDGNNHWCRPFQGLKFALS